MRFQSIDQVSEAVMNEDCDNVTVALEIVICVASSEKEKSLR